MLMFILLSITIGSCYSIEPDCSDNGGGISIDPGDGFWEYIGGVPDGAYSIAVASNGDIWASNFGTKIYLSTDNGDTWIQKGSFVAWNASGSIAISPVNNYIFFANQVGVFRSTNRGETWVDVRSYPYHTDVFFITEAGEIYTGSYQNIYYSSDNGDTWVEKGKGLPLYEFVHSLAIGKDSTLYAGTHRGVYKSTDGGDTWMLSSTNYDVYVHGLTISDDGSIFAAASYEGVLKSTDSGMT
jgi:photosystem II stability/assembly factor-like uncharacterized protein